MVTKRTQSTGWGGPRTPESVERALALVRARDVVTDAPRESFAAFVHLVRGDTRAQSLALLEDVSPAVRTYAAQCLLREHPEEIARVLPLVRDPTPILLQEAVGGGASWETVGGYLVRELRTLRSRSPAHAAAFADLVTEGLAKPPPDRGAAG
jgi:hypothetical protein